MTDTLTADLRVGDLMWDQAGNLVVTAVTPTGDGDRWVHVVAVDEQFEADWLFTPGDLFRVVNP